MSKTVEQIYQKKTQHEHILTRPDMYIGTIEPVTDDLWVFDDAEHIMKQRKCTWIPGLYKIFDEILVNAADNKVRDFDGQTVIKVWIDRQCVRVFNNGEGIPVQRHREHHLWIPEMIFGHLLTSSNYNDEEAKVTGGRNGFGAKLTNVYSSRFEVETVHARSRKRFYMQWRRNMLDHDEPAITPSDGPDYTMVTFYPDFEKFGISEFTDDMLLMMRRRVLDLAGCTDKSLKCYLNDERIAITTFPEYVDLFPTMGEERVKQSYARVNERWEVCVRVSNIGFQQVSFVNSIATTRGGTHVKYILDQIIAKVTEQAKRKSKTDVKPHMIRPHIFVFINCLIENPSFDSQTKETLNSVRSRFGSVCDIPQSLIDYILKSGIVERSVEAANSKLTKEMASKLKNSDRKQVLGIPKLDDANEAGGKMSHRCTLILTEGDSAKTLCTAGLAVRDTNFFGVFPLRGKLLNVRDATLKKVMECEEIQNIMKIMGLDIRTKHTSVDGLRYGHLMIMADQDHDGSHIKGLIINFIHHYWPDLLRVEGFLQQFITPIIKARKKGKVRGGGLLEDTPGGTLSFFSLPDYFKWKDSVGPSISNYNLRYYKGLGTSGSKEGREYFENIERHRLTFVSHNDEDRIAMAFAKDRVEERKQWITQFKANENGNSALMDYSVQRVSYSDFVDKELILFSVADCERSIPSAVDGFKPGQRKILFACFKRNLTKPIKVAQFSGYVAEHSAYHHGEQSLVQTIIGMAQDFVGSNNIPLLHQGGQFGSRLQGGKDHSAGRYIFTRLESLTRFIFHPSDDFVVTYRDDDGLSVEPFFYVPVIPMVLVNGTSGIGTGFSTSIPNYDPITVIDNLVHLMDGEPLEPMRPWYFGFTGEIEERERGKYISHGKLRVRPDGVVSVTELPIGVWTQQYKRFLEDLCSKELVIQYREHNTDVSVDFDVMLHPEVLQAWQSQEGLLEERLQLREFVHASNLIAFNREGQITKYLDAESLLKEFYIIRLEFYGKRKEYLMAQLRRSCKKLENMVRFVREVVDGTLVVTRRKKRELLSEMIQRGYAAFPPQQKKNVSATTIAQEEEGEEDEADAADRQNEAQFNALHGDDMSSLLQGEREGEEASPEVRQRSKDYDYLLGMRLWSLTAEMITNLENQLQHALRELEKMERLTPKDMWKEDLQVLKGKIESTYEARLEEIDGVKKKKLAKKQEFTARMRIPLLSDKARQIIVKDCERKGGRGGGGGGMLPPRWNSSDGGGSGVSSPTAAPGTKKPPQKRRRKARDSDDESSLDEDWLLDDPSEEEDDEAVVGSRQQPNGPSSATAVESKIRAAPPRTRQKRAAASSTAVGAALASGSSASAAGSLNMFSSSSFLRPPQSTSAVSLADDLNDLDLFGLDNDGGLQLSAPAPAPPLPSKPKRAPRTVKKLKSEEEEVKRGAKASQQLSLDAFTAPSPVKEDEEEELAALGLIGSGNAAPPAPRTRTARNTAKSSGGAGRGASAGGKKKAQAAKGKKRRRHASSSSSEPESSLYSESSGSAQDDSSSSDFSD